MAVIRGAGSARTVLARWSFILIPKYVVNAFNQHWIEGWIKKGWKRGKNEPVKNTDLWKRSSGSEKAAPGELQLGERT